MVDPAPPILSYFVIILSHNSLFPMFSIIFGHSEEDPHACGANYPSQERAISPAARTTLHQGGSKFACGANYPHQALKGGYFVFVWRVGT